VSRDRFFLIAERDPVAAVPDAWSSSRARARQVSDETTGSTRALATGRRADRQIATAALLGDRPGLAGGRLM
jgi:hypothetical protein